MSFLIPNKTISSKHLNLDDSSLIVSLQLCHCACGSDQDFILCASKPLIQCWFWVIIMGPVYNENSHCHALVFDALDGVH